MPRDPSPVTVVLGDEDLLAERAVTTAVHAAQAALGEGTPVERVSGGDLPAGFMLALATPSLLGGGRIVVVDRAQELPADARQAVTAAAADPSPGTALILRAPGPGRLAKFFNAVGQHADVVKVPKLKPAERARWVRGELRDRGRKADERAVAALVDAVGGDLRALAGAVDKLQTAVPPPVPLTAEDVDRHLARTAERGVFEFVDAVFGGDPAAALAHLAALTDQGEDGIRLLAMLARQTRMLLRVAEGSRLSDAQLAQQLGPTVRDWQVRRYRQQARRYQPAQLRRALLTVADADAAIRTGRMPPRLLLELTVARLAGAA